MSSPAILPSLFCGHGSPINIVDNNRFTDAFSRLAKELPRPNAVLCISAHWLTHGTLAQTSKHPEQIFDFSGFPQELYQITYRPPGHPQTARKLQQLSPEISITENWGLDHGSWALMHRMYPEQDVPTLQLSIDKKLSVLEHLDLAKKLISLKKEGVLILGSGNIVHNLRKIDWNPAAKPHAWALEFEEFTLNTLTDHQISLADKVEALFKHPLFQQCHPTPEHFIPLIYAMGSSENVSPVIVSRGIQNAAISMATVQF